MTKSSFDYFYDWHKAIEAKTLWQMPGPKNTSVIEVRAVVLPDGDIALVTIYKDDHGFQVYRQSKS